jgi:hypothetical protein
LVPDNWFLGELHPVLVDAMGWVGYHRHAFRFGGGFNPVEYSTRQMVMECGPRVRDDNSVLLMHVIRRKGQPFTYEYDFGDSWLHEVKVERMLPYDPEVALPVCLEGARARPPEDCGSFPGYAEVLRVLARAESDEDRRLREWLGSYDPEHFDLEAINRRLGPKKAADSSGPLASPRTPKRWRDCQRPRVRRGRIETSLPRCSLWSFVLDIRCQRFEDEDENAFASRAAWAQRVRSSRRGRREVRPTAGQRFLRSVRSSIPAERMPLPRPRRSQPGADALHPRLASATPTARLPARREREADRRTD